MTGKDFPHYNDALSLEASAESGCSLCAQLVLGFQDIEPWDGVFVGDDGPR